MARKQNDGLFKRGSIWWCWVGGKRYTTKCRDKKAAAAFKARLERANADPDYLAAHKATVGGAVNDFLEQYRTRSRKPATVRFYESKCGHVIRMFGADSPLATVTAKTVDRYVDDRLKEGASRYTVSKELTALRQVLLVAKRYGAFPTDLRAIMPVGFDPHYTPRDRFLSWEELAALVPEVAHHSLLHAGMVVFYVATACRKAEGEAAHGEDIDWQRGVVYIRGTKTEESDDEVPIPGPFRPWFDLWVPKHLGPLFGEWHNMTRDLAAACKRAGIQRVTANDLRRSNASLLRRAGASVDVIARMLRHADSRMVERVYGRIQADDVATLLAAQIRHSPPMLPLPAGGTTEKTSAQGQDRTADTRIFNPSRRFKSDEEARDHGSFPALCVSLSQYTSADLQHAFSTVAGGAKAMEARS